MEILNHTTAHVFALALKNIYPEVQIAIGPSIEGGFHYDFDLGDAQFSSLEFPKIEKEMKKIILNGESIKRTVVSSNEAKKKFANNPYKIKTIDSIIETGNKEFSIYSLGSFDDLCKGPHLPKLSFIKAFKLTSLGGAYFQGDKSNKMIHRVYGTSWFSKEQLDKELALREERKERDHRTIGKALKIFTFNDKVGKGLPMWLPNGHFIKEQIRSFILEMERKYDYQHISTPVIGSKELYEISGHLAHYSNDMFPIMEVEGETFVLRPMSCPHHAMVFASEPKSYRDLPYRISEEVLQHRYESSGSLIGLERVRAMTLTDSHVFVSEDQVLEEIKRSYKLISETLERFNIDIDYIELALHEPGDKEKYHNNKDVWKSSEKILEEAAREIGIKYVKMKGEAAFYGPKIDIQVKTALGHVITMSTIQLDFVLGSNFKLKYKDKDGELKTPVIIHRGLVGSYERFIAILLEQTKGVLPLWLSPLQAVIIPVSNSLHNDYSKKVSKYLTSEGIRNNIDERNERMSYKIRELQTSKIPYQVIIGDDELKNNTISYRKYGEKKTYSVDIKEFTKLFQGKNLYN
ncbi:MAG: threonine--tRNA ligase [Mycoplasmataceae bacterium]|nr:threonine--tRNA ligase [Mycoplasmataceae bacterium]